MKKLMTLVFAAMIAMTLSVPAWSQAPTGATTQSKTTKNDKKEAAKAAKDKKKAEKLAAKKPKTK